VRSRGLTEGIKLRRSSLYTVIEALQRDGLIEPVETNRLGRHPERTIYRITPEGREEFASWLTELLTEPATEYPAFHVALSLLAAQPCRVVITALRQRCVALEAQIAAEIRPNTRLVACSHVSWASVQVVDMAALAASGKPVLLDAAQALGAVPPPIQEPGCDFYACSGQKWLCGPEGSGCLYVAQERVEELEIPWPSYVSLADAHMPLDFEPAAGARRFDLGFPSALRSAFALASLEVLREAGWDWVYGRAASLAAGLGERLSERGIAVLPRGQSTLVSFRLERRDADEEVRRLAGDGVVVRSVPIYEGVLRASVGAWSDEGELERLVDLVAG